MSDVVVPLFDLREQNDQLQDELENAFRRVVASGRFIQGPEVAAFEGEIASYLGVAHAIGVASGTDALWLALRSLGIGRGDRVVTASFTFFATISAILNTGAEPVLVDIRPDTFNIDLDEVERALSDGDVKAIVPVHLFGHAAEMSRLLELARSYEVPVVEDAAQAIGGAYAGRPLGSLGDLGCFSFFPTKNLGAFGDGGLVVTNNGELAERIRLLKSHGSQPRYFHQIVGTNSRLDELQAAFLRVKLPYLQDWVDARREHAAAYDVGFAVVSGLRPPATVGSVHHAYHQYTVRVPDRRDDLVAFLADRGIGTSVYYPLPAHLQAAARGRVKQLGDLPESERASQEVLSCPIFPEMTRAQRDEVISTVAEFFTGH